MSESIDFKC